jgi:uncharacterized membrane protein YccC
MSSIYQPERTLAVAGLRTAVASILALAIAYALHLDRPYWAAMTVWLVAQPTRGLQLERGVFRVFGTIVGSAAGLAMLRWAPGDAALVALMALWIAVCVGAGNWLRHLRGYAAALAGYSGVIIALIPFEAAGDPMALAWDRLACNLIGVATSIGVAALLAPRTPRADQLGAARRLAADALTWSARMLREGPDAETAAIERRLMQAMATTEGGLDAAASGSPKGYRQARLLRSLFAALLRTMAAARTVRGRFDRGDLQPGEWSERLATALGDAADAAADPARHLPDLYALAEVVVLHRPRVGDAVRDLAAALDGLQAQGPGAALPRLIPHRDTPEAWRAGVRSGILVGGIGTLWLATRWPPLLGVLLGAAIFGAAFSRFDHPSRQLRLAIVGAVLGALSALAFRWLVGEVLEEWIVLAAIAPLLAVGAMIGADRRYATVSLDFSMIFLLVSAPAAPLHGLPASAPHIALGVVLGMSAALLAFGVILPIDPRSRLASVSAAVVQDLERLARGDGPPDAARWRARSQHRALRLALRASTLPEPDLKAVDAALAGLALGASVLALRQLGQPARPALDVIAEFAADPEAAARRLVAMASAEPEPELAALMRDAAAAIVFAPEFFRR